jgi:hypothetical protein
LVYYSLVLNLRSNSRLEVRATDQPNQYEFTPSKILQQIHSLGNASGVAKNPKGAAANFPLKDETSDNGRSM